MNLRQNVNLSNFFGGLGDGVRRARLTVVEIAFLIAALVFAAIVAFFYFSKVQPLGSELAAKQARERELTAQLAKFKGDEEKRVIQASNSEKILDSLDRFQAFLKPDERGMTQIINEIDSLGKTHKILVGDASYRVAEAEPTTDENGNPLPPKQSGKKETTIYPTLGVDTTVIGDYPNLRRFLADLERSRQFLIINSLTFQGGDDKLTRAIAKTGKQIQLSSAPDAVPVSLKVELDTYFQPPISGGK
jgi:Type II secretion system (T2SS), protein M subtype b